MRRLLSLAVMVAGLVVVAPAQAAELGKVDDEARAGCPERCQALGRVSGYQLKLAGDLTPFKVEETGRVTAFTITLGKPNSSQQRFFASTFGGPPRARISILRRGTKRMHRLVAQSSVFDLTRYLGTTHRFRFVRPLPVRKDYMVALTVPTWAPAFAVGQSGDDGWRSSRDQRHCSDVRQRAAQQRVGGLRTYGCFYRTARLLYTATFEPSGSGERDRDAEGDRRP